MNETIEEKKKILNTYKAAVEKYNSLKKQEKYLRTRINSPRTAVLSGVPSSKNHSDISDIMVKLDDTLKMVRAAEDQALNTCAAIERIILNVLSNAMKFTSHGGNIYVDMEVNDRCNKVIIKISNDGEKINFEDRLRIFERFTQSESLLTRRTEGTGIGLTLVKSLVKLHNGEVYVNTEFEEGTQFCIELPIRKIKKFKNNNVREKSIVSKVEKFNIEFSDIYN